MAAFGVTLSLTEKTPQQIIAYLEKMQQLQVGSVFSSLQIPGDDPGTLQDTLAQVGPLFRRQGLEFVVDVSPRTFRNFTLEQLRSWGVTSLRIDNGMEPQEIAEISHDFRIVLNASTLNDPFLDALQQHGFHGELEAWHNYYPRRNTGLDVRFFEARNNWLKAHGVRSAAFFAGNSELRGTVFEGLPTLDAIAERLSAEAASGHIDARIVDAAHLLADKTYGDEVDPSELTPRERRRLERAKLAVREYRRRMLELYAREEAEDDDGR